MRTDLFPQGDSPAAVVERFAAARGVGQAAAEGLLQRALSALAAGRRVFFVISILSVF